MWLSNLYHTISWGTMGEVFNSSEIFKTYENTFKKYI